MVAKNTLVKIAVGVVAVILLFCMINVFTRKSGSRVYPAPIPVVTSVPTFPEKFAPYDPTDEEDAMIAEDYADYIPAQSEQYVNGPIAEQYVDAADVYASPGASGQLLDN